MSFWQNEKYEHVNKLSQKGDFIRGLPAQQFPWLLLKSTLADHRGDVWRLQILCLGIEGNDLSLKVTAQIQLEAYCQLSQESMQQLGIECDRLLSLNLFGWNEFLEKTTLSIQCPLEKLEGKAKEIQKLFFKKINEKYSIEFKKNILLKNIKECKISNFS
jgi:hypothetical protein